jgi:hypothetical protein
MGKHYKMVSQILGDLEKLDQYSALKVEFLKVGVKKADLRAACTVPLRKQTCPWPPAPTISTFTCYATKREARLECDARSGRIQRSSPESCPNYCCLRLKSYGPL